MCHASNFSSSYPESRSDYRGIYMDYPIAAFGTSGNDKGHRHTILIQLSHNLHTQFTHMCYITLILLIPTLQHSSE
jgi:hypothetical protein